MVHDKPIKITINAPVLMDVKLDVVVWHHVLPDLLVTDRGLFLSWNFGHCSTISLESSVSFLLPSTYKLTVKLKDKIVP